ncbi:uncharacterized protein LOC115320664 [Ixodes scapularis]|uniref:uncharacterized protein LOC115320664 n=1 Tax=Ixodes scapularis TaxID=6945 RepID=UPI001C393186|nr:uncharacterized protein LOC115320664 [Ixodes scapularis]
MKTEGSDMPYIECLVATEKTLYVGMFILTDSTFQACTSYRDDALEDYLSAFVGSVSMRFWDLSSPAVKLIFTGSRALTDEEEQNILGKEEGFLQGPVKGADAVNRLMDIEMEGESIFGQNVFYYVLTRRNITEEKTKAKVNTNSLSFGGNESNSEEESFLVNGRSNTAQNMFPPVEGLSQYGSICTVSVGLGKDNGRNFSGVTTAAKQIANILGPMYNGTIERRKCDMNFMQDETDFHFFECRTATMINDDQTASENYDCLQEPPEDKSSSNVTSPQQFFEKYHEWTPCGVSYLGSVECPSNPNGASSLSSDCHLSCCLPENIFKSSLKHINITAPDGRICDSKKVCVAGNCTTEVATSTDEI